MIREAIILAGGFGTRLNHLIDNVPKPMAPVNGRPFLEYQLDYLDRWEMKRVILSVGFKKDIIRDHFGNAYKSMQLIYAQEDEPLGTGGAILNSLPLVEGFAAFIFNGDTYFDVNLQRMDDFRKIKEADVCIALRYEIEPDRFGIVEFDHNNKITNFYEKHSGLEEGYINGGVYLIRKDYLLRFGLSGNFSFEKDFLQKYCPVEDFFGLRCFSYFRDIGIPEDYHKAQDEFKKHILY